MGPAVFADASDAMKLIHSMRIRGTTYRYSFLLPSSQPQPPPSSTPQPSYTQCAFGAPLIGTPLISPFLLLLLLNPQIVVIANKVLTCVHC